MNTTNKEYLFGFDLDNIKLVEDYVKSTYSSTDYEIHVGYGDDVMNGLEIFNEKMLEDKKFIELIENCDGEGNFDEDEDAFFAFAEQDNYLSKHMGEYAEAYSARAPMVNKFDLRFLQDFNVNVGKTTNTLQFSLDILNFGNMLNSEWGVNQTMSDSNYGDILKYEGVNSNNEPTFSMAKKDGEYINNTYSTSYNYNQCWQLQIGLRYIF